MKYTVTHRYFMFGRGICEKYQSRDEKIPEPIGEENVSRLVFFANTPANMIYLFFKITPNII